MANHNTNQASVLQHRADLFVEPPNTAVGCLALIGLPFMAMIFGGAIFGLIFDLQVEEIFAPGFVFAIITFVIVFIGYRKRKVGNDKIKRGVMSAAKARIEMELAR